MDSCLVLLAVEAQSDKWARQLELLVRIFRAELAALHLDGQVADHLIVIYFLRLSVAIIRGARSSVPLHV